jgi:PAS domain S-box-containing protein
MKREPDLSPAAAELRRRAEKRLREHQPEGRRARDEADLQRLLHELQVHQIELEMQNDELRKALADLEMAVEKYTDLYDFAPVGYFSLDPSGVILEANLTGAAFLGVERSRLISRRLLLFVSPVSRPGLLDFLKRVFTEPKNQTCEALLQKEGAGTFWASFRAASAISLQGPRKWCRVTFGDISARKQAEAVQRRMEALAVANQELKREIIRRETVEEALTNSEQHLAQMLEESRRMQEHMRLLSRQLLSAQEEERKKISRELHDVIAQTLTGINVRLTALKTTAKSNPKNLQRHLTRTQQVVGHSIDVVHRFARELRPTVLDDLGLIPALRTFMKNFRQETGLRVSLWAFSGVERMKGDKRTVLYRVAQEALNNIARHAQASRAEVKIQKLTDAVRMVVQDDGRGFQTERVLHARKTNRLGILGMRERLEMVGGSFAIQSTPGKGTTVVVQVPLS